MILYVKEKIVKYKMFYSMHKDKGNDTSIQSDVKFDHVLILIFNSDKPIILAL